MNSPVSLNSSIYDATDYLNSELLLNIRLGNSLSTHSNTLRLGNCTAKEVFLHAIGLFPRSTQIEDTKEGESHVVSEGGECWVCIESAGDMVTVTVRGEPSVVETISEQISQAFDKAPIYIKWVIKEDGESVKLPVEKDLLPSNTFYPQIEEGLSSYYDRFLSSRSNVLVMYGPPGTGKTSFIRGLLHHSGKSAIISYDPGVLQRDSIFASFLSGREDFMVLEDADNFLGARSKGNTVMHRFLNVGDGLVSTKRKKIIFTTNLPTIKDVDPALMRPGRCFDVLKFSELTEDQALKIDPNWSGGQTTLSNLFNERSAAMPKGVGFV